MSSQFYAERRKDRAADREADRQDRIAERAERRKDADADRRRKAADRKAADEKRAQARQARAAQVGRITGWITADPARAFVRLVQACSIGPAVVSQIGALTDASVGILMAALLAVMLEGSAWALVAMGSRAEGERSTRTYRLGAWTAGAIAAWINYSHGVQQYAAHHWVAWVLALSSLVAVWLTDLQTHSGKGPTRAQKKTAKQRAAHAKARAEHHPEVVAVAERLLSATPHGRLHPDDAWQVAWSFHHGAEVPGVTAELIGHQLQAQARVAEVAVPMPLYVDDPEMPPDPFLEDENQAYRAAFPAALEAASRRSSGAPEPLDGKGLQRGHGARKAAAVGPQREAPGNAPQGAAGRPLAPEDLARVRALADLLEDSRQGLSVKKIRELLHCRSDYAMRLRNQVQAERAGSEGDDGGEPVGAR